jgi:hypothetical protein
MPINANDYGAGTQIKPVVVQLTFDAAGNLNHVGIGFEVYLASAIALAAAGGPPATPVTADAMTWTPPAAVAARLSQVTAALLSDLTNSTGLPINHALGRQPAAAPPPLMASASGAATTGGGAATA